MLSSQVVVNGLDVTDQPILGVLKLWGAGATKIISASLISGSREWSLTPEHNMDTQVRRDQIGFQYSELFTGYLLPNIPTSPWYWIILLVTQFVH